MRICKSWYFVAGTFATAAIGTVLLFNLWQKQEVLAQRSDLLAVAARYPRFTSAQRMAILRERQAERHPQWKDLSALDIARRLMRIAATAMTASTASQAPLAPFLGNLTAVTSPGGTLVGLVRQPNCSLNMGWASYTLSLPTANYSIPAPTANYNQVLHSEAGLTTTGGVWPEGCVDPILGVPSRTTVPLGMTSAAQLVSAAAGYNGMTGNQVIWTVVSPLSGTNTVSIGYTTPSDAAPVAVNAADLNGDGIADLVVLNTSTVTGGTASLEVELGNADGSLQAPVSYPLPGETGISAVIDDFNGDGKPDIVASSQTFGTTGTTYWLSFLEGNGDGTFVAAQSVEVTAPSGFDIQSGSNPYFGLIAADLRGNGANDLVTSGGIVLLGNGNGTFTQLSTLAFPTPTATSQWGPNVVAANFTSSGKMDLAVANGESILLYTGNGDGTFNPAGGYASIDNTGALSAGDLDGDGNIDLYSGTARAGYFGGDQFETNQSYALMGNGNGTFQGAPEMPFVFTGANLADLNGDGIPDGVGVTGTSAAPSFTTYLGSSNGSFTTGPTLSISPITIQGTSYNVPGPDSFGLGDTRGNGDNDLVYIAQNFYGPNTQAGFFVATGNGNGSFNAPVFTPVVILPAGAPANDFDDSETLSNLFVADINGDGKADLVYNYSAVDYYLNTYIQGIAVQLSNGDGTFKAPQLIQTYSSTTAPPPLPPQLVQVGATRASGVPDLFVLLESVSNATVVTQLELYLGNGDGTFGTATTPPVADNINEPTYGTGPGQIVLADMNGDGKPDLITLGTTTSGGQAELAISLGNGDGTFQTPTILDFGDSSSFGFGLAAADFNGDGKIDVAVTGFNPPADTGIFLGNGDGTVQTFSPTSGVIEPAEGINLIVWGPAMAANFSGTGSGLPDLVAGSAVLINQPAASTLIPTTTTLMSSATNIIAGTSVTLTATVIATPTPTGTVTFYDGTNTLGTGTLSSAGIATYSTTTLSVGTHSITASYPAGSTYAGSTSAALTITVTAPVLTATTSTLSASSTTVNSGASVTLTDTVTPASGTVTPTGTVNFLNGTTTLMSGVTLTGGVATYTTTSLPVGADAITAVYSGDTNYSGSTSNSVTVTVQSVPASFTIGASPSSATVSAGASTTTTITVTPAGGFNQQVSFACTGLPTGGSCSFNPTTVTPNGTAASTTTLTIATAAQSGALTLPWRPGSRSGGATTLALLAAGALWVFGRRKNIPWMRIGSLVLVLVTIAAVAAGCGSSGGSGGGGGGGGSTPQTYTITVTGTAGTENQTATFTLTVN